jgi:hypothetical protein
MQRQQQDESADTNLLRARGDCGGDRQQ